RDKLVTGVQTCALPISAGEHRSTTATTPGRDGGEGLVERGRFETMIAKKRRRQSGRLVHEREGEPAFVTRPRVVDVEVVASELKIGRASCRERGEGRGV